MNVANEKSKMVRPSGLLVPQKNTKLQIHIINPVNMVKNEKRVGLNISNPANPIVKQERAIIENALDNSSIVSSVRIYTT
jgi:hypothetical protein